MSKTRIEDLGGGHYLVPSASEPGVLHKVDVNEPSCQCKAFQYRGGCRHLKEVAELAAGGSRSPLIGEVFTTRYANRALRDCDVVRVQMSRRLPKSTLPYSIDHEASFLAPSWQLLKQTPPDEFEPRYLHQLDELGVESIAESLRAISAAYDDKPLALLCFENVLKGEVCHRRIFAEWWYEETSQEIPELTSIEVLERYGYLAQDDRLF